MPSRRSPASIERRHFLDGSRFNPYILDCPIDFYRRHGSALGFEFSSEEVRAALDDDGVLGLCRYQPEPDARVNLSISRGSYVLCRVRAGDEAPDPE